MEDVKGEILSINDNGLEDVFGNPSPFNVDHIWPLSKGGSKITENKMKLSKETNNLKKDKTKGSINDIRFAVEIQTTKKDEQGQQDIYGRLYIKKNDNWYEIINSE